MKKIFIAIFVLVAVASLLFWNETRFEKDAYVRFDMEIYDIIVENYWQEVDESKLAEIFHLSLVQAGGDSGETLSSADRKGVVAMLSKAVKKAPEEKRKTLALDTGIIVLNSLYPQGRNGLLSDKEETEFRDTVNNINKDQNLYSLLEVEEGADVDKIAQAYLEKKSALENDPSSEAKVEIEQINHAYEVLSNTNTKAIYDETRIEPSVMIRETQNDTLYFNLTRITPATFQEVVGKIESITEDNKPAGIIL